MAGNNNANPTNPISGSPNSSFSSLTPSSSAMGSYAAPGGFGSGPFSGVMQYGNAGYASNPATQAPTSAPGATSAPTSFPMPPTPAPNMNQFNIPQMPQAPQMPNSGQMPFAQRMDQLQSLGSIPPSFLEQIQGMWPGMGGMGGGPQQQQATNPTWTSHDGVFSYDPNGGAQHGWSPWGGVNFNPIMGGDQRTPLGNHPVANGRYSVAPQQQWAGSEGQDNEQRMAGLDSLTPGGSPFSQ